MSPPPVRLGPFELDAPIGRGGMGLVFRGHHRDQGVQVAVKVIEHKDGDVSRTFQNEIRAMAGLDHPGVVWVYDVGEVPARVEAATGGQIPAGAPYIAMEYASRGTLQDHIGTIAWEPLLDIMLQLLDALAHAHARGVVHRDLKPGNVLLCGPEDLRPGLKLADFGIAHAVEKTEGVTASGSSKAIGTLHYMSPEQIRADMADYGPGTDIYALGHLVWHLLQGHVPFKGRHGMALIRAQLDMDIPELVGVRAPEGFMDWVRVCTAKDPADRFQRAAEAAAALIELGPPVEPSYQVPDALSETLPTVRLIRDEHGRVGVADADGDHGTAPIGTAPIEEALVASVQRGRGRDRALHTLGLEPPQAMVSSPTSTPPTRPQATGFPAWRRRKVTRRSLQLLGAGLALWGVRSPPLVGRIEERNVLWAALERVQVQGKPEAVLLTGAMGTGKSRLGLWVGERAHELAVGTPLRSERWKGGEDAGDPIRQLWERYFRLGKDPNHNDPDARRQWISTVLGRIGMSDPDRFEPLLTPGLASTHHALSAELLAGVAVQRPAVVFLDDVGPAGLQLIAHVLERDEPIPVLFVAALNDAALAADDDVLGRVEALQEHPSVRELRVDALPEAYRGALVEEMLGLAPDLAAQVVERTQGNPMFAVQLISDWIDRGVLELGPVGFRARAGERLNMPSTMAQVWDERVRQVLEGQPHRSGALLERAAALGMHVVLSDWRQVCDDPDGSWARSRTEHLSDENEAMRLALVEKLVSLRLVQPVADGFHFVHGMLREALLERSRHNLRLASHHRACAAMLSAQPAGTRSPERLGHHLLESGDVAAAIEPLLEGVERRTNTTGYRSALSLLSQAEDALRGLSLPLTDTTWAAVWNLRSRLFAELGELEHAETWALRVLAHGDRPGWETHAVQSRLSLGLVHLARGEWREADHEFARVLELSDEAVATGWAFAYRALLAGRSGQGEKRREFTSEAVRRLRRAANSRAMAACWRVVGTSCRYDGQLSQAEESLKRSLALSERMGHLYGQAEALAELGEVYRAQGRWLEASEQYRRAIYFYELTGSSRAVLPRVNLAVVCLQQGEFDEAHALLSRVRLHVTRQGRELAVQALPMLLLATAAGRGEWEEYDHHLRQSESQARQLSLTDDGRAALALAARWALEAGQRTRHARAKGLLQRASKT